MARSALLARGLAIALLLMGYPALAHYTNVHLQNGLLGATVAMAPVWIVALVFAFKAQPRWLWLWLYAIALGAGAAGWTWLEQHFGVVYWLQDAGMQCVLLMTFARTLFAGRKPLCVHFAEMAYGDLTPEHAHYARQVTWAWAGFFGLMALVSTLLFFLAPLTLWSVFANFLTLPLVALMFIVEHGVRRKMLPNEKKTPIWDTVRLWKNRREPMNRPQHAE